jgi:hypothetical protein
LLFMVRGGKGPLDPVRAGLPTFAGIKRKDFMAHSCHYCGATDRELRPYGPGGAKVCFECATSTPEREAEVAGRHGALLEASGAISPTGLVAIGEDGGPRPYDPRESARDVNNVLAGDT